MLHTLRSLRPGWRCGSAWGWLLWFENLESFFELSLFFRTEFDFLPFPRFYFLICYELIVGDTLGLHHGTKLTGDFFSKIAEAHSRVLASATPFFLLCISPKVALEVLMLTIG